MLANLCLWDCQHNLHADKNMIQYCQCRIGLSNDIVTKKWNSTPAEEVSIFITVGCTEFEVTRWNTFNAFFSCIKWIRSEWMRYFWLPYTVQKQIGFLFFKGKKRIKRIHGFSEIFEELHLLFIWKTEDATKIMNSLGVQSQWCSDWNCNGRRSCQFKVPDSPRMKSWAVWNYRNMSQEVRIKKSTRGFKTTSSRSEELELCTCFSALEKLQPQKPSFLGSGKFESWFYLKTSELQWHVCKYFNKWT